MERQSERVLETINRTMRDNCWLLFKGLTTCEVVVSELGDAVGAVCKAQRQLSGKDSVS